MGGFFYSNYQKEDILIDNKNYQVFLKKQKSETINAPRLLVVSYLPNKKTSVLLRLCIETIKKFTDTPYELWIVDNNSPMENIKWLNEIKGINLTLNRTQPKEKGSYSNAIGLEIGRRVIDQESKYIMTLHQDIAVCKKGWLQYLLSKFNGRTKAIGIRLDKTRVRGGILHVLGYIVDFQLLKKLNLDFFPELPKYDVGDRIISEIKNAGYEIFATPNSIWDKKVIEKLPNNSPYKNFNVDRSIDNDGNVIFMHLGRGVNKSIGSYIDNEKSIEMWNFFIEKNLFPEKIKVNHLKIKLFSDINYSVRRFFVDKFFIENIHQFDDNAKILDIGGKKENKRGMFDIGKYPLEVKYANIDASTNPDYLCDAAQIHVENNSFDGVILAEVLEHIKEPKKVLAESYRILKPGGKLLVTTPFMINIHADPYDYGRYTEYYFQEVLQEIGFNNTKIEKQGGYYSVLANIIKMRLLEYRGERGFWIKIKRVCLLSFLYWFQKKALIWDNNHQDKTITKAVHTTGYGIVCEKIK